jgi:hypothetical protein
MNLTAGDGTAVREFKLEQGHGYVDHLLFVDRYAWAWWRPSPLATPSSHFTARRRLGSNQDSPHPEPHP